MKKKRVRPPRAREEAEISEARYREKFAANVLVRLTTDEVVEIDSARAEQSRAIFLKEKGLQAARRNRRAR